MFLIVYESVYNNKFSYKAKLGEIGDVMKKIQSDFNIKFDFDYEKLNSNDPFSIGTFGRGFYDIDVFKNGDDNLDYVGRIMIFHIE